jgi:hypothetical protein
VEESFVQNGIFLLQEAFGEDLECCFFLDQYGPRSREVFESLVSLEREGKITVSGSPRGLVIAVTLNGICFINQGGQWGPFFDVPPVRVPEGPIDRMFALINRETPRDMEALGTALYVILSAKTPELFLEELKKMRNEGKLSEDLLERAVVEGYRRLKRLGIRVVR